MWLVCAKQINSHNSKTNFHPYVNCLHHSAAVLIQQNVIILMHTRAVRSAFQNFTTENSCCFHRPIFVPPTWTHFKANPYRILIRKEFASLSLDTFIWKNFRFPSSTCQKYAIGSKRVPTFSVISANSHVNFHVVVFWKLWIFRGVNTVRRK